MKLMDADKFVKDIKDTIPNSDESDPAQKAVVNFLNGLITEIEGGAYSVK